MTLPIWYPKMTRRHGKTGFRGVTHNGKGFKAELYHKGKRIVIGTFKTAIEAAKAWDAKALELQGPRSDLNFGIPAGYRPRQLQLNESTQHGTERTRGVN